MPELSETAPTLAVAATSAATAAPTSGTAGFVPGRSWLVRVLVAYSGTVSSCNLRFWFRDRASGTWYAGPTTDQLEPLAPGGASPVNESRDIEVGLGQEVYVQVAAIAGGGTVAVRLVPVATR
jgi:hypothetical protein